LPPSRLALSTGDLIGLTVNGRRRLMEIKEIVDTESRRVEARSIDPEILGLPLRVPRRRAPPQPAPLGPVHVVVLDLPTLTPAMPTVLTWLAVFADPWPGAVAVWRSLDGASYERLMIAEAPATVGETLDALPAGPVWRWDRATRVRVKLYGGALASATDLAVLNGRNAGAVRNANGAWEVLQFAQAELVDANTYELSRLLRGQGGSEWAMAPVLAPGATFVLLNEHLVPLTRSLDDLGRPMQLRIVAADRDHGDATAVALDVTPQTTALDPLAPAHLSALRSGDGVHVAWVRRTRVGGDAWEAEDVPLGEERERYRVDILNGSDVVRTLTASEPTALYAAADEIADFGSAQSSLTIRVAQVSTTAGRGIAAEATLSL
jgi:hypothetical protein